MTNPNLEPEQPARDLAPDPARHGSEDTGGKAGLAGILPLIIVSVLAILVVVWLFAH